MCGREEQLVGGAFYASCVEGGRDWPWREVLLFAAERVESLCFGKFVRSNIWKPRHHDYRRRLLAPGRY